MRDAFSLNPGILNAEHNLALVAMGPVLIIVAAVLALLIADVVARRLLRCADGVGLLGSVVISMGAALLAGGHAGYLLWLQQTGAGIPVRLFPAAGPAGSYNPHFLNVHAADTVAGWSSSALIIDWLGLIVSILACAILLLTTLILLPYLRSRQLYKPELFPLLLTSVAGIMLLGFSRDLMVTFIAIEVLSLPLYVLCGLDERRETSRESSLKYFLLGAFASGFFVYGAALLYGFAGHLNYLAISNYFFGEVRLYYGDDPSMIAFAGIALVGVGFAFKLALVPFHAWTPDVYQGAPTPITAFMASGVKLGVFIAALRFIAEALPSVPVDTWRLPLAIFAVASMVVGNLFALHQSSLKRLLAYSAITHTGYLALALCVGNLTAAPGMLVYLVAYYLASFGALSLVAYLSPLTQDDVYLDELHEISQKAPGTSAAMVILMLSMIGMPLTAGFIGKLLVFTDAWRAGLDWLVVIAVLNSVVSAYFYLRVILAMYMQPRVPGGMQVEPRLMEKPYVVAGAVTVALTLLFGVLPDLLILFNTGSSFVPLP